MRPAQGHSRRKATSLLRLNGKGLQGYGDSEMESDTSNPYRSPREECHAEQAPEGETLRSCVDNIILALLHASAFLFSLVCFAFFAFAAIDSLRPHSIVQENPRAHPPRGFAERIADCATFTVMAIPFFAILAYLLRNWCKLARRWRTERLSNALADGADDVGEKSSNERGLLINFQPLHHDPSRHD